MKGQPFDITSSTLQHFVVSKDPIELSCQWMLSVPEIKPWSQVHSVENDEYRANDHFWKVLWDGI